MPRKRNSQNSKAARSAANAAVTLIGYSEMVRAPGEELKILAVDLLADILHLCGREGWVFDSLLEQAHGHVAAETEGGPDANA